MTSNMLVGCATIAVCMAIQCFMVTLMLRYLVSKRDTDFSTLHIGSVSAVLTLVLFILFAGNILQVTIWSWVFMAFDQFDSFATAFYHSMVNFTTLGYGDYVMDEEHRLLGALEAANGMFMLGLSTSVLYSVFSAFLRQGITQMKANRDS